MNKKEFSVDIFDQALFWAQNTLPECSNPVKLKTGQQVACGHCYICLSKKRKEWIIRNKMEMKNHKEGMFITLTFDDKHLKETSYYEIQNFLKRLRKYAQLQNKTTLIKYFGAYENGEKTGRPHYHLIIFGYKIYPIYNKLGIQVATADEHLARIWGKGFCKVEPITDETIVYTTKYIIKEQPALWDPKLKKLNKYNPTISKREPFFFMSKGLGFTYLKHLHNKILNKKYITNGGYKHAIPRSYCEKLKREININIHDNDEEIINEEFIEYAQMHKNEPIDDIFIAKYIEDHYNKMKTLESDLKRRYKK